MTLHIGKHSRDLVLMLEVVRQLGVGPDWKAVAAVELEGAAVLGNGVWSPGKRLYINSNWACKHQRLRMRASAQCIESC